MIIILLLIPLFLPGTAAQSPIVIKALTDKVSGAPGDVVKIPFQLINLGSANVSNITVYVTGPSQGFLYETKIIPGPIKPNESVSGIITVQISSINPVSPGDYKLKLVAQSNISYSETEVTIHVGTYVNFDLSIGVGERYIYGNNITASLRITSRSNGVIIGRIGYTLYLNDTVLQSIETVIFLQPGESWYKILNLTKPAVGQYTLRLWANFAGHYKSTIAKFIVYQRKLKYRAYFENGAIHIIVTDKNGSGVGGITVKATLAGSGETSTLVTAPDGTIVYPVEKAGLYQLTLNLDGKVVTDVIPVHQLALDISQDGKELWIRVRGPENPVPNITITVSGPLGKSYAVTNASGEAIINLTGVGYGTLLISAESTQYLSTHTSFNAKPPVTTTTLPTTTTPQPASNITLSTTTIPKTGRPNMAGLALLMFLSAVILAGTSYVAFFTPTIHEEELDHHYFVKVHSPRLRGLENFRYERGISAVDAKATKGRVSISDGKVVWEIEHLEPSEEAYLQIRLG